MAREVYYYCAHPGCVGYAWPASVHPHPCGQSPIRPVPPDAGEPVVAVIVRERIVPPPPGSVEHFRIWSQGYDRGVAVERSWHAPLVRAIRALIVEGTALDGFANMRPLYRAVISALRDLDRDRTPTYPDQEN